MPTRVSRLMALALLQPLLAAAQGPPPCPEFRVSTATTLHQRSAVVSADSGGRFVVAWSSDHLRGFPDFDVFAQRFGPSGAPEGPEFQVNTGTIDFQGYPSVASASGGGFVVAWHGYDAAGDGIEVFTRRYDAAGVPLGPQFQVNTYTTGAQYDSSIGVDALGRSVVAWTSYGQDGGLGGIFAQRFDATGAPLGAEMLVNEASTFAEFRSAVAVAPGGAFVVVWVSHSQIGSGQGVFGRRYDAEGVPQGPQFLVNTYTPQNQSQPAVAFGANGNFLVVWSSDSQDGDGRGIFGQRFDASAARLGAEFRVNVQTTGDQSAPRVAAEATGGFVVAWSHYPSAYGTGDIMGRRLSAQGVPEGGEFRVNSYTTGGQYRASVAALPNRGFAVVWNSEGQDGDQQGVYGSVECARLYTLTPCRVLDTRAGLPLAANSTRFVPVSGACGIPPDAQAVALNVTAVNPTDTGFLRLYPAGPPAPFVSTVNFVPGRTRANNAIVSLGFDGHLSVECGMAVGSTGTTHVVLDVYGYFRR